MKIVLINSSARINGNTERLLNALDRQLTKAANELHLPIDIQHVLLAKQNIQICLGCRACFDKGTCVLKDDLAKIIDVIMDCDAFVIASPVYMEDVNSIMKNLIDRLAFCSHRPSFYGKCAVAITTSGSGSTSHSLNTMRNALAAWGVHGLSKHKFRMGALMENERIEELYLDKLSKIASSIIRSVHRCASQKPTLFSLISFRIHQKYYRVSDRSSIMDRAYWEKKGWLDPKVSFFMPIRCNKIKLILSRALAAILSKLFI